MTIGIYSLYWEEQDVIYIGQSQNIEKRLTEHTWLLKNCKHTNYKVQNAYNLYGMPTHTLLEVCPLEKLSVLEIVYTDIFDSIRNGLNIVEAGSHTYGVRSRNSKYSKIQILKIFSLLAKTTISYSAIACRLKVKQNVVNDIAAGNSHIWLKESYPNLHADIKVQGLLRRQEMNSSEKLGIKYPIIVDPLGEEHSIVSLRDFCKTNSLLQNIPTAKMV